MLYVFLVDTGVMLPFEMELAMENVDTLMITIATMLKIPTEKQVLIMQGGETLDSGQRICNYSSGENEDNPIFLFSKSTIESSVPPSPSLYLGSETSLKEEVEHSLKLPPTYDTVVSRAQLALRFQDMSAELCESCLLLVNEQHLQRQGWHAVIANLENIASTFETRATLLEQNYKEFMEMIPQYQILLDNFPEVICLLAKIPVFTCLLSNVVRDSPDKVVTLLDWINAQDTKSSLEDMVHQCVEALEQIQQLSLAELIEDRDQILGDASNRNMKDIGGLEERLTLLSKLCENARMLAQGQSDMAQGFSQNQVRAQNLGDASVLPDLCSSHQKQLSLLMNNYSQLRDIRRRCAKAKDELSGNLHARLRWVMMVEKKICDCDNKLVLYHESMKRIKKRVEILEQIELAPRIYIQTIKEVVRRRNFAAQFIKWAHTISSDSQRIYKDEMSRRHEFSQFIGNHFLQTLFNGINDVPATFAHSAPELFDVQLPAVTPSDLHYLKDQVPELLSIQLGNDKNFSTFGENSGIFKRMKSLSCDNLPMIEQFDYFIKSTDDLGKEGTKHSEGHEYPQYNSPDNETLFECMPTTNDKNNRIEESSMLQRNKTGLDVNRTCDSQNASGLDRIVVSNLEVKENATVIINKIRKELEQLKSIAILSKQYFDTFAFEKSKYFEEMKASEKSVLKEEHDLCEIEKLTESMNTLTKKVGSLTAENGSLRTELKTKEGFFDDEVLKYRSDLKEQKHLICQMELDKEQFEAEQQIRFNSTIYKVLKEKDFALKKSGEQLLGAKNLQAKNEERLQILFNEKEELRLQKDDNEKAMRELLLQKIEVEKCLNEAKKNIEEKEKLVRQCLEKENLEKVLSPEAGPVFDELLVERFRQRIKHLEEENTLLKDRLQSGADGNDKILFVELQQCLDQKIKECESLKAELELLQQKPRSSQVVFKDFQKGGIVQVYFNDENALYMIRSIGETPYFVHLDSLVNLEIPADLSKTRSPFQAQILDKEYCQAKKPNNRFKVPVGTKFYRVKVRPWSPTE